MTFEDIKNLTKNRIDTIEQGDYDTQIDSIVSNAINHCYIFELSKYDPDMSKAYIPVIDGIAKLPDDMDEIVSISPELEAGEYRRGKNIISSRNVTFEIVYTIVNEPLVNGTDEPNISAKLHYLLSTYACYTYFSHRKKEQEANMYLNEYMLQLKNIKTDSYGNYQVKDVTGW